MVEFAGVLIHRLDIETELGKEVLGGQVCLGAVVLQSSTWEAVLERCMV